MVPVIGISTHIVARGDAWVVLAKTTAGVWMEHKARLTAAVAIRLNDRVADAQAINLAHWKVAVGQRQIEADYQELSTPPDEDDFFDPDAAYERWLETRYDADLEGFQRWEADRGVF